MRDQKLSLAAMQLFLHINLCLSRTDFPGKEAKKDKMSAFVFNFPFWEAEQDSNAIDQKKLD